MLDSIRFSLVVDLDTKIIAENWIHTQSSYPNQDPNKADRIYHTYSRGKYQTNNVVISYKWKEDTNPIRTLEVSIMSVPKLLISHNCIEFSTIELVVFLISSELNKHPALRGIDISNAKLHRVDFCYNYRVQGNVPDYLCAIGNLEYPHRDRTIFFNNFHYGSNKNIQGNGVSFVSKNDRTIFYDKHAQSGRSEARGLLRHERSLNNYETIRKATNLDAPTLGQLNWSIAQSVLQQDLDILNLNKPIRDTNSLLNSLPQEINGVSKCNLYKELLVIRENQRLTKKELASKLGVDIDTINRYYKHIKDAGFNPAITQNPNLSLPPLQVPLKLENILKQLKKKNRKFAVK